MSDLMYGCIALRKNIPGPGQDPPSYAKFGQTSSLRQQVADVLLLLPRLQAYSPSQSEQVPVLQDMVIMKFTAPPQYSKVLAFACSSQPVN